MTDRVHQAGVALVVLSGLLAVANGAWFVIGHHPFNDDGYSEEVDLTRSQARDVNPGLEDWLLHVSDQTGSVTVGWGLFVATLGVVGLPRGESSARIALAVGGLPTLAFSAFGEFIQFGTLDRGTIISITVFALFVLGLALASRDALFDSTGASDG